MNYTQQQSGGGTSATSFGTYSGPYPQQRRPTYGTSAMGARDSLGGYTQNVGTLNQNGLRVIDGLLQKTS